MTFSGDVSKVSGLFPATTLPAVNLNVEPSFESFLDDAAPGTRTAVWCEFLFDSETAVTAYHKLRDGAFGFLLESVVGGEQWARYSFLGSGPREVWRLESSGLSLWNPGRGWRRVDTDDPIADLEARLKRASPRPDPRLPRFWDGGVGYFGYVVRRMERLGAGPPDDRGLPTAMVMFSDVVVAVDNLRGRARAITTVEVGHETGRAALERLHTEAVGRLEDTVERLRTRPGPAALAPALAEPGTAPGFTSNFNRDDFVAGVRRIKEYVAAGDAFQVVLSQRFATRFEGRPLDLYRALRTINPSRRISSFSNAAASASWGRRPRCWCVSRTGW